MDGADRGEQPSERLRKCPIRIMHAACLTAMPLSLFPSAWRTCSTPRWMLPPASHSIWSVERSATSFGAIPASPTSTSRWTATRPRSPAGLPARLGSPARVTVHAAFGTSTVRWEDMRVDIARTRSESYARPGSLPAVEPAGIEADLLRRDFTVNSMALRLGNGDSLLDPAGGRGDLERRVIRVLHRASFRDDPTRVFRAVRYAARLGFELDPETDELARAALREGLVGHLSGSRVRAELLALLGEATAPAAVGRLGALGACRAVWPGLDCDPQTPRRSSSASSRSGSATPRAPRRGGRALVVLARRPPRRRPARCSPIGSCCASATPRRCAARSAFRCRRTTRSRRGRRGVRGAPGGGRAPRRRRGKLRGDHLPRSPARRAALDRRRRPARRAGP